MATNIKKATKEGNYSEHLRLVILGKTGSGKSATANSLVGSKVFKSSANSAFVTENCQAIEFEAFGKKVLLVDTPGIGDLIREQDFILNELKTVMEYAYPGPHAFLIIISCHRFTKDEKESIELISSFFGKDICFNSVIVFTGVDNLEFDGNTVNDYVNNCPIGSFKELIQLCGKRYLGVSNRWSQENEKLKNFKIELFDTITKMVEPGNKIYTSKQFEASQKHYEAEKERIKALQISAEEKEKKLLELISNLNAQINEMQVQFANLQRDARKRNCQIL